MTCTKCKLSQISKINCMGGVGPTNPKIILVGEAPGEDEERSGKPLVGQAGQLLSRLLIQAGINRHELFITNTVRCRPVADATTRKGNRAPEDDEIEACSLYLDAEIERIKPNLIVTAGNIATKRVLGTQAKNITSMRGQEVWSERYNCKVIPIIHPSALLRGSKLTSSTIKDLERIKESAEYPELTKKEPVHYHVLENWEQVNQFLVDLPQLVKEAGEVSVDTETSGLDFLRDKLVSLAICWKERHAVGIRWRDENLNLVWDTEQRGKIVSTLQRWIFQNVDITKYFHNGKFDEHMLREAGFGLVLKPKYDTMLMHYLTDSDAPHGLKDLAKTYTDMGSYEDELAKHLKANKKQFYKVPWDVLGYYNCADTDCTLRLAHQLWKRIRELHQEKTLTDLLMVFYDLTKEAEQTGVTVDLPLIAKLTHEKQARIKQLETDFYAAVGQQVNLRSPKQLNELFFQKLKWKPIPGTEGKTGYSLNEEALTQYATEHPEANILVEYRGEIKDLVTYLHGTRKAVLFGNSDFLPPKLIEAAEVKVKEQKILGALQLQEQLEAELLAAEENEESELVDQLKTDIKKLKKKGTQVEDIKEAQVHLEAVKLRDNILSLEEANSYGLYSDGKVHTSFLLHGTVTGRISSRKPNLQNIKRGSTLRNIFTGDPGCYMLEADYKQAEVRVLAAYSNDRRLIADIVAGIDIHRMIAADRFGIPPEQVTEEQRSIAKTVVFGVAYGRQAKSIADQFGIPEQEAQIFIDRFFAKYFATRVWQNQIVEFARQNKFVMSMFGRIRWLPLIDSPSNMARLDSEHEAINSPVQSVASDLTLLAAGRIQTEAKRQGARSRFLFPVHDSGMFNVYPEETKFMLNLVREEMGRKIIHPEIPFDVDMHLSKCWKGEEINLAA